MRLLQSKDDMHELRQVTSKNKRGMWVWCKSGYINDWAEICTDMVHDHLHLPYLFFTKQWDM